MDDPVLVPVAGVAVCLPVALIDELALADTRRVLREKFPSILRLYLDSTRDDLDIIAAALELPPPYANPALRLTVHSIRSASAQFGAAQLAAVTHKMEQLIAQQQAAGDDHASCGVALANAYAAVLQSFCATEDVLRPLCDAQS